MSALMTVSCGRQVPPDPNAAERTSQVPSASALQTAIKHMSDEVNLRRLKGEISDEDGQKVLTNYARQMLKNGGPATVKPEDAWRLGEVYRTAKKWPQARTNLEIAVRYAASVKNEDRRVNDSLRLAQALAELGKPKEAIKVARSVFNTPDTGAAPILPAVLLEIVPAAKGKGADVELGDLLRDAIKAHLRTVVDPQTPSGKAFMEARWHHIGNAWREAVGLYSSAGNMDKAREAALQADRMMAFRKHARSALKR